jgi:hypothetical protein
MGSPRERKKGTNPDFHARALHANPYDDSVMMAYFKELNDKVPTRAALNCSIENAVGRYVNARSSSRRPALLFITEHNAINSAAFIRLSHSLVLALPAKLERQGGDGVGGPGGGTGKSTGGAAEDPVTLDV